MVLFHFQVNYEREVLCPSGMYEDKEETFLKISDIRPPKGAIGGKRDNTDFLPRNRIPEYRWKGVASLKAYYGMK